MKSFTLQQFKAWGAAGGRKSKRKLTAEEARRMVQIREQKKAQKKVENSSCIT